MPSSSSARHLTVAAAATAIDALLASPLAAQGFGVRGLAALLILWLGARWAPYEARRGDEWPRWDRARASLRLAGRPALIVGGLAIAGLAVCWLVLRLEGWTLSYSPTTFGGPRDAAAYALTAVVLAPIVEEIVYRGVVYPRLRAAWGPRRAIAASGLAFWVVHWAARGSITSPHHLAAGWLLGWARERTGSLLAPTLLHALGNLALLLADIALAASPAARELLRISG